MNDFRFADPNWIHGVWCIAVLLTFLIASELRRSAAITRLLSARMQQRLVAIPKVGRRITSHILLCAAFLALVIALMRPQWGGVVQQLTAARSQVMICLDVSKSMLAEDVVPSRLERAKAEIISLLALLDDSQQVGLIAFAGKPTVLSPMTTDFGFLNLILKEAGPHSAGLGGTKIGDAIRTGTDSFRSAGDINRLLLIITDGEDHDSFPVDAAAYAREKGVRIVSIGFGDSAGSRIEISDPITGVKTYLTDRDGEPVVSRLDDQTLRELALQTQGAYIPAGGGQLDLQSIYDSHISSMLKGTSSEQQRIVRNEGYQWCLIAALCFWAASLILQFNRQSAPALLASALLFITLFGTQQPAHAQTAAAPAPSVPAPSAPSPSVPVPTEVEQGDTPEENADAEAPVLKPRETYNLAVSALSGSLDQAETQLTDARNRAGVDGELRFRSSYNLGWLSAEKASSMEPEEPEEALKHLQVALGRFREAVRLRPDNEQARFNLEVVAKRILALKDRLNQQQDGTIEKQLDALLENLRSHQTELKSALAGHDDQQTPSTAVRANYRSLGVTQRQIISDFYEFSRRAQTELKTAQSQTAQSQATPPPPTTQSGQPSTPEVDPALRAAQLDAMLAHIDRAMNWLQKSRSFTRRIVPSSAFLRWSAAIRETRQARDQLRDPVQILSVLLADTTELNNLTLRLGDSSEGLPRWLTVEYLAEEQLADTERTKQLNAVLQSAIAQSTASQSTAMKSEDTASDEGIPEELLEQIQAATPWIEKAANHLDSAANQLADNAHAEATVSQTSAIEAFELAAEQFFDLRRLIEATYAQQLQIQNPLADGDSLAEKQTLNLSRAKRLEKMLDRQIETLSQRSAEQTSSGQPGNVQPTDSEQQKQEIARLKTGKQLLDDARVSMHQVDKFALEPANDEVADTSADTDPSAEADDPLDSTVKSEPDQNGQVDEIAKDEKQIDQLPDDASAAPDPKDVAVEKLAELRRLFFTLIEHLKDTASRQAELNQDTTTSLSENKPEVQGPLAERQQALQTITDALAKALGEQAQQAEQAAQSQPTTDPNSTETLGTQGENAAEILGAAAELVAQASEQQTLATQQLSAARQQEPSNSAEVASNESSEASSVDEKDEPAAETTDAPQMSQLEALKRLVEAIQLLDDQNDDQEDQRNEDNDQQDQNDESGDQEQQQQTQPNQSPQPSESQRTASAEQLLQIIRDQEAKRRRDKQQVQAASGTADKDW